MNCSRNDVVLLPIPLTNLKSRKVRPAIVIGANGADLFLVPAFATFGFSGPLLAALATA
jgi:hypothetical protein